MNACIYGHKPNVSHLHIFGCLAYVNVQKDKRCGLQSHTQKCIFVGYPAQYKARTFFDLKSRKELISDTAVFGNSKAPVMLFTPEPNPVSFDESVVVDLNEYEDQVGVRQPTVALLFCPQTTRCLSLLFPPLLLLLHLLLHQCLSISNVII